MNDSQRVELNELCSGLVDGQLTEAEKGRLQEMLRESPEARRFYVRSMELSASLYSYASEMQSEPAEPRNIIRPAVWRRWALPLAAAAVVTIGVWIGRSLLPDSLNAGEEEREFVARISGSKDPHWVGAVAFQNGDELQRGQRLELTSGFAEITFDSGALIVVEGPVSLDLDSAWQTTLRRGTLKANIPQEAIGFKVANSSVDVVDLGTEFSMTAEEDGTAEVFVLNGQVEVEPRSTGAVASKKILMKEKQSRRFAVSGVSDVRDSEQKFVKLSKRVTFDLPKKAVGYAHWSFDSAEAGGFAGDTLGPVRAPGSIMMPVRSATAVPGKFSEAIAFTAGTGAQMNVHDFGMRQVKTMAFWVRLPDDASGADGGTFARFGAMELGWNRSPADGSQGALRISNARGHVVASTSLRDGRWHHVAAVVNPASANAGKPGGKWQARLYVDGRLDAWTGRHPVRKGVAVPVLAPDLMMIGSTGTEEGFRGIMDELYVSDRALTPMEIRSLMRSNRPYFPENLAGN